MSHLSLLRPHPPFVAPEPYNRLFDPETVPVPNQRDNAEQLAALHPFLKHQLSKENYLASSDPKMIQQLTASYYGLIKEVDDHLGRLFEFLKDTNRWQDTLIIFTSDHGEQLGDHCLMSKHGFYDESYHIPMIIYDPRKEADHSRGYQFDSFTENIDIMPTMLDWLDLDIPSQCDGQSLLPFIERGESPDFWRTEAHWEFDFRNILDAAMEQELGMSQHQCQLNVIRDNKYKYVHFTALPSLLFDLENDPGEHENLANNPEYSEILLRYAQKMLSWRMNHDDRKLTETLLHGHGPSVRKSPLYYQGKA